MIRLFFLSLVFIAFASVQAPQTPVQPPPPKTPTPPIQISEDDRTLMLTLLARIEKLSTEFKTDSKSGQLLVDRSTFDEIAADVQQVRAILKR